MKYQFLSSQHMVGLIRQVEDWAEDGWTLHSFQPSENHYFAVMQKSSKSKVQEGK